MPADPVQRRLAAILAADVAGYSRLMGENEEGTLATLTAHLTELIEPCIAEHSGRVVKTTGDGLLAEFTSVVDAVKCAVAFQEGMADRNTDTPEDRRIEFRIGVNLGDVIVQEDDVYGDGVNVAARLEGLAEPSGIYISGTVFDQIGTKLELAIDDLGPQSVKNIAEPIRTYRVRIDKPAPTPGGETNALPLPVKPSIAVLPFANISGDAEQEYFADGIAEDIITAISQSSSLSVVARTTSFDYKGRNFDIRWAGREMGASHVLEGSVRMAGNRVRISAQLIDVATGHHVWAERFDRDPTDIFVVQDEITVNVASSLQARLVEGDQAHSWRRTTESVDAWSAFQKGRSRHRNNTREDFLRALGLMRDAVAFDPEFSTAMSYLAWLLAIKGRFGGTDTPEEDIREATMMGERSVALDASSPFGHAVLTRIYIVDRRHDEALRECRAALAFDTTDPECLVLAGLCLRDLGLLDEAHAVLSKAVGLFPIPPDGVLVNFSDCYRLMGRLDEASALVGQVLNRNPSDWFALLTLALIRARQGRPDDARGAVSELLRVFPGYDIKRVRQLAVYKDPAIVEEMIDHLRAAGLQG